MIKYLLVILWYIAVAFIAHCLLGNLKFTQNIILNLILKLLDSNNLIGQRFSSLNLIAKIFSIRYDEMNYEIISPTCLSVIFNNSLVFDYLEVVFHLAYIIRRLFCDVSSNYVIYQMVGKE